MIVVGLFGIFEGISGIASDEVYQRLGSYVFKFDLTTWGWIHLIVGILVLVTGIAILGGKEWGRVLGIGLTALSMILHFMWLPWAPLWSIVAIAVGVFIIWALCNDKSEQLL
ncbi:hypothetical protein [Streptomyces sp. NPDC090022]|uniref:DUF7144 family membrane protein n=1 Tax=Streptomyces sp. NPDC090022 TaxID=3365920 RepID=UPI00381E2348